MVVEIHYFPVWTEQKRGLTKNCWQLSLDAHLALVAATAAAGAVTRMRAPSSFSLVPACRLESHATAAIEEADHGEVERYVKFDVVRVDAVVLLLRALFGADSSKDQHGVAVPEVRNV